MNGWRSWWRHELRISAVYVGTSLTAVALMFFVIQLLGRFRLEEYKVAWLVLAVVLLVVAVLQGLANRRWLRQIRTWFFAEGHASREVAEEAYRELIRFPARAAALSFALWCFTLSIFIGSRLLLVPEVPFYRNAMIVAVVLSSALVAWTLQYFLFKRAVVPIVEELPVGGRAWAGVRREPILRRYGLLFGLLIMGATIFGATLAYGLIRDSVLEHHYRQVRRYLQMAERYLYDLTLPGAPDVQSRLELLGERLGGTFRIVPRRPPEAIDIDLLFGPRERFLGAPYEPVERQRVPERWRFVRSLRGASGAYLEYDHTSAEVRAWLEEALLKVLVAAAAISALVFLSSLLFLGDLLRPLRLIRKGLHPTGESLRPPPLVVSDDDLATFALGIRAMFLRLRELFQELLDAYWRVKDERTAIHKVTEIFEQRNERERHECRALGERLNALVGEVRSQLHDINALHQSVAGVVDVMGTLAENITDLHGETLLVRQHFRRSARLLRDGSEAAEVLRDGSTRLARWYRDLLSELEIVDKRTAAVLGDASHELLPAELVERLEDHVRRLEEVERGIAGERRGYRESIEGIEETHARVGAVRNLFQAIGAVREQIDVLSFQAALVAARAAEFERDFRVVADEIRDLAERAAIRIQQVATAVWGLHQQGRATLKHLLEQRHTLLEAGEHTHRAGLEAAQSLQHLRGLLDGVREGQTRLRGATERFSLWRRALVRGRGLMVELQERAEELAATCAEGDQGAARVEELFRVVETLALQGRHRIQGLIEAMEHVQALLRELLVLGEGVQMQLAALQNLVERLQHENEETERSIRRIVEDLDEIEALVLRDEVQVRQLSTELRSL